MEALHELFDHHSTGQVQAALARSGNNFQAAVEILLVTPPARLIELRPLQQAYEAPLTPSSSAKSFQRLCISEDKGDMLVKHDVLTLDDLCQSQTATTEDEVVTSIQNIFPDACTQYIKKFYHNHQMLEGTRVIDFIANAFAESGYDRNERAGYKRKRKVQEDDEGFNYESLTRPTGSREYLTLARKLLEEEFPFMPANFIERTLNANRRLLAFAYPKIFAFEKAIDSGKGGMNKRLKHKRKIIDDHFKMGNSWNEVLEELEYARYKARKVDTKAQVERDAALAARLTEKEHEDANSIIECNCCFGECSFDKITHCIELHFFCVDCARRNAENEIGNGRYKLKCMDGSGCQAEFGRTEVLRFLSESSQMALGRLEQDEAIRIAEIDGLVKCPFCDYAAICEPIEVDKEFRCQNLECMEITCRYCERRSHLPKSCQEIAKELLIDYRHTVEEAMTKAMIRKCNKCKTPFIKDSGCNKMVCNKTGCRSMQCYVCSETVNGYDHFNDRTRGGAAGNCPLFDNVEERHDQEVQEAAKVAIAKVKTKNPNIAENDLKIGTSEEVTQKEVARKLRAASNFGNIVGAAEIPALVPGQPGVPAAMQHETLMRKPAKGILRCHLSPPLPPQQQSQQQSRLAQTYSTPRIQIQQRPLQQVASMIRAINPIQQNSVQHPVHQHATVPKRKQGYLIAARAQLPTPTPPSPVLSYPVTTTISQNLAFQRTRPRITTPLGSRNGKSMPNNQSSRQ